MKKLYKKRILSILVLMIILALGTGYLWLFYFFIGTSSSFNDMKDSYDKIAETYYNEIELSASDYMYGYNTTVENADIAASAARYLYNEGKLELEPAEFDVGYIVKNDGKKVDAPEVAPDFLSECLIDNDFDNGFYYYDEDKEVVFSRVSGDYYYFVGASLKDADSSYSKARIKNALDSIADAYDCELLFLSPGYDEPGVDIILAGTSMFGNYKTTKGLGISPERLTSCLKAGGSILTINGKKYWVFTDVQDPAADDRLPYVIQLCDMKKLFRHSFQSSAAPIVMLLLFSISFTVWLLAICRHVSRERMDKDQYNRYSPRAVKTRTLIVVITSALLIGVLTVGEQALENVFSTTIREQTILSQYFERLDSKAENEDIAAENSKNKFAANSATIARLLNDNPDLRDSYWLDEASSLIGADYITIYNNKGNEIFSTGNYRGLTLGTDEKSSMYDFRRLLNGVYSISHKNVTDEITGLTRDIYGTSLNYLANSSSYGALLITVDPSHTGIIETTSDMDVNEISETMAPHEGFIAGVDPETGEVLVTSKLARTGGIFTPEKTGIPSFSEPYMGFATVAGTMYYVCSDDRDGIMYYCGTPRSEMFKYIFEIGMYAAIMVLIISAFLWLINLKDYNQINYSKLQEDLLAPLTPEEEDPDATPEETRKRRKRQSRLDDRQKFSTRTQASFFMNQASQYSLSSMSPESEAKTVFTGLLIVFTIYVGIVVFLGERGDSGQNIAQYIIRGDWERGVNLFAIAAILFMVSALVLIFTLLRIIRLAMYSVMGNRGRTISTLIFSIFYYATLIICVFIALGYLGVDTRALLASAGLVGMGLTLGARDFIADIIAGIVIITDGTYQVGDTVEIGGFRGEVTNLGTRSTTIVGRGDNVKTIRNSTMGDVINYSRLNSWYPLIVTIDQSTSLEEVENMLREELPAISNSYPEMITGPEYRGVDSITGNKISLLILTECRQTDYSYVQREVNREVKMLFEKNNIPLL